MKSNLSSINVFVIILALSYLFLSFTNSMSDDKTYKNEFINKYAVFSIIKPKNVDFAGEKVDVNSNDLWERFDKELLKNTYWQSNGFLLLKRAHKYFPIIEPILKSNGIPDDFKYLALIESGLQNVTSPAGAKGFWQIMKRTGKEYGLEINSNVDEKNWAITDFNGVFTINASNKAQLSFERIGFKKASLAINEIEGKSILVIGGAGTIGSSYIRAALKYKPNELIVVDTNENGLTELTRTLRSDVNIIVPKVYITYPMSFSSDVFYKMLKKHGPFDIVANFAAHKHVRSEKDSFSIESMINNNVLDAKKLLDYLKLDKPSHFFCVSTDKAANPANVMGASKKLMENIIMSYSKDLKITTARFANVAFSNGSLLYGFIERLLQSI